MPKHFEPREREIIYNTLIEEGKKSWQRYGIRRTNVEDLAKAAGISKGTFYSFFKSKELFFMEILEISQAQIKGRLMDVVLNQGGNPEERFVNALMQAYGEIKHNPWLVNLMTDKGEYAYLFRKLPQEKVEQHIVGDDEDTSEFMKLLGIDSSHVENETISAALRGLFFVLLHEQEVGKEHVDKVFKLLLEGLAQRIFRGDGDD